MYGNCMHSGRWGSVLLLVLTAAPAAAAAQAPLADEGQEVPPPVGQLPVPLNEMTANFEQLEQTGYFQLVKVELGRTRFHNQEALLWTVRVVKPIQAGHAMLLLRRIGDVRFYRTWKDRRTELHGAQLYYPTWIESDAANGRSLDRDEEFQVWVYLDHRLIHRLDIDKADTIEFRPLRR